MRRIWIVAAIAMIFVGSADIAGARSSGASHGNSVHVQGYTRKDGTYVAPYNRSSPHQGGSSLGKSGHEVPGAGLTGIEKKAVETGKAYIFNSDTGKYEELPPIDRTGNVLDGTSAPIKRGTNGRIERSTAAKDEFKRLHPCPSTGQLSGSCSGYVIDHVVPLKMGGPDAPSNMQWQTIDAAKAKDKIECSGHACR